MTGALKELGLSELVDASGVPASTIHYYRRTGMIPPPLRREGNHFVYDEGHLDALTRIRSGAGDGQPAARARVVAAAIEAFRTRSYAEVSVSDIAEAAGMAKGSVYRHFESKEALLTAAIEALLDETTERFEAILEPPGPANGRDVAPQALGFALADVLPILLELGSRAARGHVPSEELARRALRTLAEAAGRPFLDRGADPEAAVKEGLEVIDEAFATVMKWAVGPDWPPDREAGGA